MKNTIRDTPDFVKSLEKGLKVLHIFAEAEGSLTLTEVAKSSDITRAAARRFLLTLTDLGYMKQEGRNFRLTPKILSLSAAYLASDDLSDIAYPFLKELTERVHESSSLSVLEGSDIIYVSRVLTRRIMSVNLQVGTRLPACCTSMGRAQLAFLPDDELKEIVNSVNLEKRTPHTISNRRDLYKELKKIRELKYAVVDQELEIGVVSIAVPVFSKFNQILGAINVAGHASRTSSAELVREVLPHLRCAARGIESSFIGYKH